MTNTIGRTNMVFATPEEYQEAETRLKKHQQRLYEQANSERPVIAFLGPIKEDTVNDDRHCRRCKETPEGYYYCEDEENDIWICADCILVERDEAQGLLKKIQTWADSPTGHCFIGPLYGAGYEAAKATVQEVFAKSEE